MEQLIEIVIRNRNNILYQGVARSITSTNDVGKFDVLSGHANFISVIKDKIVIRTDSKTEEFPLKTTAILKVINNKASVFVGV